MKDLFEFLRKERTLTSFRQNVQKGEIYRSKDDYLRSSLRRNRGNVINSAFTWANTQQGHTHWQNISNRWRAHVKRQNKTRPIKEILTIKYQL